MDGTIYLGGRVFDSTRPFLDRLIELGISCSYMTNNNSRSRRSYVDRLAEMGIAAEPADVLTSAHATIEFLRQQGWEDRKLFLLGSSGLQEDLTLAGYEVAQTDPDIVVVGFDDHLTYDDFARTAYWIEQGLPYIATHPDRVCPTNDPIVLPDCGAFCALLAAATGRQPDIVCGKPNLTMLDAVFHQFKVEPYEVAVVGDRIYTDMAMARNAGCVSVLTLTGEAKQEDAEAAANMVDLVVNDLGHLDVLVSSAKKVP